MTTSNGGRPVAPVRAGMHRRSASARISAGGRTRTRGDAPLPSANARQNQPSHPCARGCTVADEYLDEGGLRRTRTRGCTGSRMAAGTICLHLRRTRRTTLLTSFTTGMRRTVFVQVTVETASCAFHARREPGPTHGDTPNVLASVFPARPLPFAFGTHRGVVKRTRPQAVSCMPRLTWMRRDQAPPASTARCSHHLDRSTRSRQVRRCAEHRRGVPVRVSLP